MRQVNAWGWKLVVGLVLGVWVRDVDCAFKLYPGSFFREHNLETRGAMINADAPVSPIRSVPSPVSSVVLVLVLSWLTPPSFGGPSIPQSYFNLNVLAWFCR